MQEIITTKEKLLKYLKMFHQKNNYDPQKYKDKMWGFLKNTFSFTQDRWVCKTCGTYYKKSWNAEKHRCNADFHKYKKRLDSMPKEYKPKVWRK